MRGGRDERPLVMLLVPLAALALAGPGCNLQLLYALPYRQHRLGRP